MQEDAARQRTVAATTLGRGVTISTAFRGVRAHAGDGLFETLVTGGPHNNRTWKTQTWEATETQHMAACKLVCADLPSRLQRSCEASHARPQAARRTRVARER
jgi:hypothetical protein